MALRAPGRQHSLRSEPPRRPPECGHSRTRRYRVAGAVSALGLGGSDGGDFMPGIQLPAIRSKPAPRIKGIRIHPETVDRPVRAGGETPPSSEGPSSARTPRIAPQSSPVCRPLLGTKTHSTAALNTHPRWLPKRIGRAFSGCPAQPDKRQSLCAHLSHPSSWPVGCSPVIGAR